MKEKPALKSISMSQRKQDFTDFMGKLDAYNAKNIKKEKKNEQ